MTTKLVLKYDPDGGFTLPDNSLDVWWEITCPAENVTLKRSVGSQILIMRALVGFAEGDLDELIIIAKGIGYEIDPETCTIPGELSDQLGVQMDLALRMMKARGKKNAASNL